MHPIRILELPTGLRMTLGVGLPLPSLAVGEEAPGSAPSPPRPAPPAKDA